MRRFATSLMAAAALCLGVNSIGTAQVYSDTGYRFDSPRRNYTGGFYDWYDTRYRPSRMDPFDHPPGSYGASRNMRYGADYRGRPSGQVNPYRQVNPYGAEYAPYRTRSVDRSRDFGGQTAYPGYGGFYGDPNTAAGSRIGSQIGSQIGGGRGADIGGAIGAWIGSEAGR